MRSFQIVADLAPEPGLLDGWSLVVVIAVIVIVAAGLVAMARRRR